MILTITLNPAVDKTYTTGELLVGHVNRMRTAVNLAGGKGVNVAKILRQYGFSVCATGFLGGYAGHFIEDAWKRKKVDCEFEWVDGETRSNMNVLADNGFVTELLEAGPEIDESALKRFVKRYDSLLRKCELVVMSGSMARGIPQDFYRSLIERANQRGVKVLFDSSGESLKQGIMAKPYLIKPNRKELEYVVGHRLKDREEVAEAAQMLTGSGISKVIVSLGEKGLLSVSRDNIYFARAKVHALNTVGCGDSVVAAYAMSLLRGDSEEEALRRATAISAANAATLESANIPMEIAEELLPQIRVEVLRG